MLFATTARALAERRGDLMFRKLFARVVRALMEDAAPTLLRLAQESGQPIFVVPTLSPQYTAYHSLVETLLRFAVRNGAIGPASLSEIEREASERCKASLDGKVGEAAAGLISALITDIESSLERKAH
jgi:hypothetical protein